MRATDIAVQKQVGRKTVFKFPVMNSVAGLFINFRLILSKYVIANKPFTGGMR